MTFPTNGGNGGWLAECWPEETVIKEKKKYYSVELQDEACRLVTLQGYTQQKAADQLGVTRVTIQTWMKKRNLIVPVEVIEPDLTSSQDPELLHARTRDLEKRLARAEAEREIVKKATAYFASQRANYILKRNNAPAIETSPLGFDRFGLPRLNLSKGPGDDVLYASYRTRTLLYLSPEDV